MQYSAKSSPIPSDSRKKSFLSNSYSLPIFQFSNHFFFATTTPQSSALFWTGKSASCSRSPSSLSLWSIILTRKQVSFWPPSRGRAFRKLERASFKIIRPRPLAIFSAKKKSANPQHKKDGFVAGPLGWESPRPGFYCWLDFNVPHWRDARSVFIRMLRRMSERE